MDNVTMPRLKKIQFSLRVEEGRMEKLRRIAATKRKTITQIVEELIDMVDE